MITHLRFVASLITTLMLVGCAAEPAKPKPVASSSSAPPVVSASTQPAPDYVVVAFDTTTALAKRTEDYSHTMEQLLSERKSVREPAQQPQPLPQPQPTDVQWMENGAHAAAIDDVKPNPPALPQSRPGLDNKDASRSANEAVSLSQSEPVKRVEATIPSMKTDALQQKLSTRVKDYPRDVSNHLEFQLLQFLNDEPVPSMSSIASLPTEDREMLAAVMDGLTNYRNTLRSDNNMLLSKKIRPLLDMSDRLRAQADLSIPTAALCKEVRKFGDYDPIEPARFTAKKPQEVILYLEVENFASSRDEHNKWETRLSQEVVLYTESGAAVWSDAKQKLADTAHNRRRDFFIARKLKLPAELGVGRYVLKVTVVDEHANRVAEASVPLVLVAQ